MRWTFFVRSAICLRKYNIVLIFRTNLTINSDDPVVQNEFAEIKDVVLEMASGTFTDCFKCNRNRNFHRTALGYVNQMFQQVCVQNLNEWTYLTHSLVDFWHQHYHLLRCNHLPEQHRHAGLHVPSSSCP